MIPQLVSLNLHACEYIIAGGFFTSKIHNEVPRDIDLFFLDPLKTLTFNRDNFPDIDKESNIEYINNKNIRNAFTLKNSSINFIYTNFSTAIDVLNSFDYVHCRVAYLPKTDELFISKNAFYAIKNKFLMINNTNDAAPFIFREKKFRERGFI